MKRLLLLLLIPLLCTGCTVLPAEERAFVVALLVEAEGEGYRVYGRIPTYQNGGGYRTATGEGATLEAALLDMESSLPMRADLSQLRLAVMDAALGDRVMPVLLQLARRQDVRQACLAAVTEENIPALAEAMTPATGERLSKALDVLAQTRREQGMIPHTTLADLVLMGDRETPLLPLVRLEGKEIDLSGGMPASSGGVGSACSTAEIGLLALLRGEVKQLTLEAPGGTAKVQLLGRKLSLFEDLQHGEVHLTLGMTAGACTPKELEADLAARLLSLLTEFAAGGYDVLGLGRKAAMLSGDLTDWQTMLPQIRWTVSVGATGPA